MTSLQYNNKLVLHIGYSKTATTTFQNSIFTRLHEQEIVNYLGIAKRPPYDFVKTLGFFDSDRISLWLKKLQATEEIAIPPFTSEQKGLIKEQFRYSKAELPKLIGCEPEKLHRYGYT